MAFHVGWRSFWWLNIAMLAAVIVLLIFFPETKWHRVHPKDIQQGTPSEKQSSESSPVVQEEHI